MKQMGRCMQIWVTKLCFDLKENGWEKKFGIVDKT